MAFFPAGYDIFKATSVEMLYKHFFRTLYNNASKLLIINGLPEKVNPDFVMSQLLLVGRIAAFKNDGDVTMLNCSVGGEVNEYYVPQRVLIANPIIGSKDLKRDEEAVVIHLTPMKELLRKKRNYYTILLKLFIKEGEIPRNYFDKQLCKRIINSL